MLKISDTIATTPESWNGNTANILILEAARVYLDATDPHRFAYRLGF